MKEYQENFIFGEIKIYYEENPIFKLDYLYSTSSAWQFYRFTSDPNGTLKYKRLVVLCPTLQILVKNKVRTSLTLFLTIKNSPGWTRTNNLPVNSRLLRHWAAEEYFSFIQLFVKAQHPHNLYTIK